MKLRKIPVLRFEVSRITPKYYGAPREKNYYISMEEKARDPIAIVDDDESVREATNSLLRSNGFEAETFSSAEEFLNSPLRAKTGCVLLDIGLPGMSGLELQRCLAMESRRIPIIFITAHDDLEKRMGALRTGAIDFLSKPFSEEALLRAICNALKTSGNDDGKIMAEEKE
jgi:FixJ family two-component response regulator